MKVEILYANTLKSVAFKDALAPMLAAIAQVLGGQRPEADRG